MAGRRKWIALAAVACVIFIGVLTFAKTEEERIRALLDDMAEGFSDGDPGAAAGGIAGELRYRRERHARRELIGYLSVFFQNHPLAGGGARYEARVLAEESTVTVDEEAEPMTAAATVAVLFGDRAQPAAPPAAVQFDLRLRHVEDEWRITEVLAVRGSPPFRH